MTINFERFSKDLDRLIADGDLLKLSMLRVINNVDDFKKWIEKRVGKKNTAAFIKTLPEFNLGYEAWYSESLALLKQLLPDRVINFVSLYEKPKIRKNIEYGNYVMQDYLQRLGVTDHYGETKLGPRAFQFLFESLGIPKSVNL